MLYFITAAIIIMVALLLGRFLFLFRTKDVEVSDGISRSVSKKVIDKDSEIFIVNLKLKVPQEVNNIDDLDIVFLLDASGSMGNGVGSSLQLAISALKNFIQSLPDNIHYGLIIFDHSIMREVSIGDHNNVKKYLESVNAKGGTAINMALHRSASLLDEGRKNVDKAVVLLSDGYSNEALACKESQTVKNKATNPVIYSIGLGSVDQSLLKKISSGEEYYFYVKEADELKNVFKDLSQRVFKHAIHCELEEKIPLNYFDYHEVNTKIKPIAFDRRSSQESQEKVLILKWSFPVSKNIDKKGEIEVSYGLKPNCFGFFPLVDKSKSNRGKVKWKMPDGSNKPPKELDGGPYGLIVKRYFIDFIDDGGIKAWLAESSFSLCYYFFKKNCKDVVEDDGELYEIPSHQKMPEWKEAEKHEVYKPILRPALVIGLGDYGENTLLSFNNYLEERYIDTSQVSLLSIKDLHHYNDGKMLSDKIHQLSVYANSRIYLEKRRHQYNKQKPWLPTNSLLAETESSSIIYNDRCKARLALLLNPEIIEKVISDYIKKIIKESSVSEGTVIILLDSADSFANGILLEVAHICAKSTEGLISINAIMTRNNDSKNKKQVDGFIREISRVTTLRDEPVLSDRGLESIVQTTTNLTNELSAKNLFDRLIVYKEDAYQAQTESFEKLGHFIGQYLSSKEVEKGFANTRGTYCVELTVPYQCKLPQQSIWHQVKEKIYINYFLEKKFTEVVEDNEDNKKKIRDLRDSFWSFENNAPSKDNTSSSVRLLVELGKLVKKDNFSSYLMDLDYSSFWRKDIADYLLLEVIKSHEKFMQNYLRWWLSTILENRFKQDQQISQKIYIINKALNYIASDFRQLIIENYKSNTEDLHKVSSDFGEILNTSLKNIGAISDSVNEGFRYLVSIKGEKRKLNTLNWHGEKNKNDSIADLVEQGYQKWSKEYGDKFLNSIQLRVLERDDVAIPEIGLYCLGKKLSLAKTSTLKDFIIGSLQQYETFVLSGLPHEWLKPNEIKLPNKAEGYHNYVVGDLGDNYKDIQNKNNEDKSALLFYSCKKSKLEKVFAIDRNAEADYCWTEEYNATLLAKNMEKQLKEKSNFQGNYQIVSLCRELEALQYFIHALKEKYIFIKDNQVIWDCNNEEYHLAISINACTVDDFYKIARRAVLIRRDAVDQNILIPVLQQPLKINVTDTDMESYLACINQHELINACRTDNLWSQWDSFIRAMVLHIKNSSF